MHSATSRRWSPGTLSCTARKRSPPATRGCVPRGRPSISGSMSWAASTARTPRRRLLRRRNLRGSAVLDLRGLVGGMRARQQHPPLHARSALDHGARREEPPAGARSGLRIASRPGSTSVSGGPRALAEGRGGVEDERARKDVPDQPLRAERKHNPDQSLAREPAANLEHATADVLLWASPGPCVRTDGTPGTPASGHAMSGVSRLGVRSPGCRLGGGRRMRGSASASALST